MDGINFVDTTFRDGNQSLWAEGMRTGMMLPVASNMDAIGFTAMEIIASSHFKKCTRELREDPWERIRVLAKKITHTPLALMMHCSISGFDVTPFSIMRLWEERLAANGISRLQLMEPSNDMSFRIPEAVRFAKEAGLRVALALVYSLSPKHTDEYYAQKACEAIRLGADVIYLKDPGGLLTPERVKTLIPAILGNIDGVDFELHSHCTTGLAPLCYLEAIQLGVKTLHTAIPPLANGSAQPSVLNVIRNAQLLGYQTAPNGEAIKPVVEHFRSIAMRERLPMGKPLEYDYYQYVHQVPGGVISNLRHQLAQLKIEDRMEEVLEEIVLVRQELGYPIMVTPFSQFVASQAAINVMLGERYREVTDGIIQYVLGFWGEEARTAVQLDVMDRIVSKPRARELANMEIPEPTLAELRDKIGGPGVSDDELLLRYIVGGDEEIRVMRSADTRMEYSQDGASLAMLLRDVAGKEKLRYFKMQKSGFSITLLQ